MRVIVLIWLYLILVVTAIFNKHIVDTQDVDDSQKWHNSQLMCWVASNSLILYLLAQLPSEYLFELFGISITKLMLVMVGYALTYPFVYDSLLNLLRGERFTYIGYENFGKKYTLGVWEKVVLFIAGVSICIYSLS